MLSSASNKFISARAPSDYLREVQDAAKGDLTSWLDSNLISDAAFQAALRDDYYGFLLERSRTINETVNRLITFGVP
jgi:hypothetical protein